MERMDAELATWSDALEEAMSADIRPQDREGAFVSGPKTLDCPLIERGEDDFLEGEVSQLSRALLRQLAKCADRRPSRKRGSSKPSPQSLSWGGRPVVKTMDYRFAKI